MKKILLSLAVVSLISFTSCKDDKKATENQEVTDSTTQGAQTAGEETPKAEAGETATAEVPKFSDSEVQKYVEEYDAFVKDYLTAAKAKDMTKLGELGQKAQEWATKGQSLGEKLKANPDDSKKYNEYIQKLAQEMTAAMTQQ